MAAQLFRVDTRRLTLRECWYQTRSPKVVILWILKLLRIRLPVPPTPYIETLRDFAVDREALPAAAAARLDPLVAELEGLGYHSPRYYRYASSRALTEIYGVDLVQRHGVSIGRVMHVISRQVHPAIEKTRVFVLSLLDSGSWLVTSPLRIEFEPVPGVEVIRLRDASPTRLVEAHASALEQRRSAEMPVLAGTPEEAEALRDRYERHCFDHNIRRGLYVPLSGAEATAEEQAVTASERASYQVGAEHAEVLVEIERLQNPKPSLKTALWLLGGSLLAFVVLGGARWEWEFVLFLIPILLFHEAGHWVAMRVFGYRNLRMFFIPLFGAAVSGQNFNVPGWKKALVSLAGPVPGVVAGTLLSFVALAVNQPWLERLALLTVVLNAINLLPFVPLDGGWFLNATLFCRRAWLETGFKVIAVVVLILASAQTEDRILLFLAVAMALSLGSTWRLGRLTERLKASGFAAQSVDLQTIPPETAVTLIDAVKSSSAQMRPLKTVARETLDVFERLNARPPGMLATLGLLAVYGMTLVVAFVGFGAASLARSGGLLLDSDEDAPLVQLSLSVSCGETMTGPDQGIWLEDTNRLMVLGTAPDAANARSGWTEWMGTGPVSAARIGPLLIATYPAADAERVRLVSTRLSDLGIKVTQADPGSVLATLTFLPPVGVAGAHLIQALEEYFLLPASLNGLPPWSTPAGIPAEQQRARHTWWELSRLEREVERSPAMREQRTALLRAFRTGDTNQLNAALADQVALRNGLLLAREADFGVETNTALDPEVLAWKREQREGSTDVELSPSLLARLGIASEEEANASPQIRTAAASGSMRVIDGQVELQSLEFRDPGTGMVALVNWLCGQGASDLRVDVHTNE